MAKRYPSYQAFYDALEGAGHRLLRKENGEINIWAHDYGNHNGPGCELCGESCKGEQSWTKLENS